VGAREGGHQRTVGTILGQREIGVTGEKNGGRAGHFEAGGKELGGKQIMV
jgi:hypothetical protein